MRAFVCICAASLAASMSGCVSSQGYMMNAAGQNFYNRGNFAQAAQEFQRASFADPYNADYIANLAASYKKQGNLQMAEQTWQRALDVNPQHQPSYHGLAQMYVETNRQQEASNLVSTWAVAQPYSAEPQIEMAWLNRELGNPQGAVQSLQQALAVNPNHPKATAALGQYYQDTGQMQLAAQMYQQSLRNDWYQPEVQSRLATLKGMAPDTGYGSGTQVAQGFGGGTQISMPFPPTPRFAQARQGSGFGQPVTNMAFAQPDYLTNPNLAAQPQAYGANFAAAPAIPNVGMMAQGQPVMPQPTIAQQAIPQFAMSPVTQPIQAAPVAPQMPPLPADTQYPVTNFGATAPYTIEGYQTDPFADQFISQPVSNGMNGGVPVPVPEPQGTVFAPPVNAVPQSVPGGILPATPGVPGSIAADPAHAAPRVSAVPEVSPF